MNCLIDTCLVSELIKPRPQPSVIEWLDRMPENGLFLSVITFGELGKGIAKLGHGGKRKRLMNWVARDLKERFEGRILNLDLAVMETWGSIMGELEKKGRLVPLMDSLIAATALQNSMVVVTRNTKDMAPLGVKTINPWCGVS